MFGDRIKSIGRIQYRNYYSVRTSSCGRQHVKPCCLLGHAAYPHFVRRIDSFQKDSQEDPEKIILGSVMMMFMFRDVSVALTHAPFCLCRPLMVTVW